MIIIYKECYNIYNFRDRKQLVILTALTIFQYLNHTKRYNKQQLYVDQKCNIPAPPPPSSPLSPSGNANTEFTNCITNLLLSTRTFRLKMNRKMKKVNGKYFLTRVKMPFIAHPFSYLDY